MCYYEMYVWQCNDWKWGNFKQHCEREYRMGETCGMKLPYRTVPVQGCCKLCENIQTKLRKLEKARADYERFKRDPARQATAEVRLKEIHELEAAVKTMQEDRLERMNKVGNPRRADNRNRNDSVLAR